MMLNRVLVLNQDYSPLMVCSAERAFVLVYLNKSELIKPVEDQLIRSVTKAFPMPSVIRLNRYIQAPFRVISLTRQNIFRRDQHECQYCGTRKDLTIDHVIPSSRGGLHNWNNLVTACKRCNTRKGDSTPEEAGMHLKRKPHKPSYAIFLKDYVHNHGGLWDEFLIG